METTTPLMRRQRLAQRRTQAIALLQQALRLLEVTRPQYPKVCPNCGTDFVAMRRDVRYCSSRCYLREWRIRQRQAKNKD